MRKWWKKVGIVTGSLLGLGGLLAPTAHAQFNALPPGNGMFAADPQAPSPPDFPNPGKAGSEPISPFSVKDEGMPNAFTCLDAPPAGTPPYNMALRMEYLSWWFPRINIPTPLLLSTTPAAAAAGTGGLLGEPGTNILVPQGGYNMGMTDGYRATLGLAPGFMPPVEVSGLFFNRNSTLYNIISNGDTVLVRPYQTVNSAGITGAPLPSGQIVAGVVPAIIAAPGGGGGFFRVTSTFNLWGVDVDQFVNFVDNGTVFMDFIYGYKHADLNDSFTIFNSTPPGTNIGGVAGVTTIPAGFLGLVTDSFAAHNQFNGGTLGLRTRIGSGMLSLWTDAKLSLGGVNEWTTTNGTTTLSGGGGGLTQIGGLYALASNSVVVNRHAFAFIPEVNINLSCQVTPNIRIFGGYNIFYWSTVLRSSDQINPIIDTTQLPTGPTAGPGAFIPGHVGIAPLPSAHSSSFFAHGINVGVEVGF